MKTANRNYNAEQLNNLIHDLEQIKLHIIAGIRAAGNDHSGGKLTALQVQLVMINQILGMLPYSSRSSVLSD